MHRNDNPKELLGIAVMMEDGAIRFYRELALLSDNPKVKEFCARLAEEEARHFSTYQQMQMTWAATFRPAPVSEEAFAALLDKAKGSSADAGDVAEEMKALGEHGALIVAIKRETEAVEFYEQLLKVFPQHAEVISQIVREEDSHVDRLEELTAGMEYLPT